jgi:uncharacterized coiled-coil DUF342 family protein
MSHWQGVQEMTAQEKRQKARKTDTRTVKEVHQISDRVTMLETRLLKAQAVHDKSISYFRGLIENYKSKMDEYERKIERELENIKQCDEAFEIEKNAIEAKIEVKESAISRVANTITTPSLLKEISTIVPVTVPEVKIKIEEPPYEAPSWVKQEQAREQHEAELKKALFQQAEAALAATRKTIRDEINSLKRERDQAACTSERKSEINDRIRSLNIEDKAAYERFRIENNIRF